MSAVKKLLSGFAKERLDRDLARAMRWNEKIRNSADFQEGLAGLSGKARSRVAGAQAEVDMSKCSIMTGYAKQSSLGSSEHGRNRR